ncbi:TraR/DksA family transcriptional regulator [Verrucosispora sp. WMMD703]|jgi:DnaK suppressor protein|uniref:Zinc finger DksA/TraR C4-type domain-containing protein n=2 Tax=Micromonospora TaxID=1873 RepID=A0A9W5ULY4_9ACTN|nr:MULTISPECIES: TraR/DksA C4-type zinc finger protein [Micromonospora]MBQ1028185.1 TraR/DksA C4-type zinc finger protein [Micromonospora sp. C95]MCZ7422471.1 TraR/DksA C4-type zinc finger protein [Verrucosispora sp. WMMA2121]NEE64240.1 TraR/DksA family transcriptional regulator [Verrucosispora sioxanthis]NGM13350.1 TraR/DksA family transcriptional regulator [Verrucosispora sioxanthis]WBB51313.1 TraR/DksA C4-type zinc finger protein [Verrucosispora sp. WMMA2044]
MLVHDTVGTGRSQAETDQIRLSLQARHDELTEEYQQAVQQSQVLRLVEVGDTAGDDQADSGTKTAERDTAQSLLRTILDRRAQYEHALARLAEGTYGFCEGCTAPIPVERLEIFPSATTCVTCKQTRERRAA